MDEPAFIAADQDATKDELSVLFSRIDLGALKARATALRDGIPCAVPDISVKAQDGVLLMGGQNYHIPITFDDGVEWICRIRRENASSPPSAAQDRLLVSEVATYRFLATTSVPVPKLCDVATASPSNAVGVGYIMMERLKGMSMEWYDLQPDTKKKILEQFADIFIALKQHPFSSIGSLALDGDSFSVGPLASETTMDISEEGILHTLGPFSSALEYRTATLKHEIELIMRGESYPANAVDAYLVHRHVLDNVHAIARREQDSDTRFYLKHTDDKGDHVLVDESHNIVGIVDWERSQVVSFADAFAAPLFLLDVGAYYDGLNDLSEDEELFAAILEVKGHNDLAVAVRSGRFEHRLMSCVTTDLGDPQSFGTLFTGLCKSLRTAKGEATWEAWRAEALQRHKEDPKLQQLLARR